MCSADVDAVRAPPKAVMYITVWSRNQDRSRFHSVEKDVADGVVQTVLFLCKQEVADISTTLFSCKDSTVVNAGSPDCVSRT